MNAPPICAVFVAPFFLDTTLRFVRAAAELKGVRLGLVSQDPVERLPADLRGRLAAHYRIDDGLDAGRIAAATRELAGQLGPVQRLVGTLEQLQVPLAEARAVLGIPGLSVAAAHCFRDKALMKDVLRAAGLPCARHALVRSADQMRAAAREIGFPLIVKPPAGAAAKDTFRLNGPADLEGYLRHFAPTGSTPTLVEEFVQGEEHSFDSVMQKGRLVWHSISRYSPAPLTVIENPWIQWCVLLPRELDEPHDHAIGEVAPQALAALGMVDGFSHMEWFRKADGSLAISEVGARPPGAQFTTLLSYAHDHDFYRAYGQLMIRGEFAPPERRYAVGAAYLRGQGRGRVRHVHGLEAAQRELGELVVEARLPEVGRPSASGYEGDGYVILRHPNTAVVQHALSRLIRSVQIELG
jgi:hypothetical protein